MKFLFIIAVSLGATNASANTVGSGGDALRNLFVQAKSYASQRVANLQWCSFSNTTPSKVSEWILKNQNDLSMDLLKSEHLWVVDSQATCGFTNHSANSAIYLSYPTCANTVGTNVDAAIFTLIHETAHHLGISDEKEADLVAAAVLSANANSNCPVFPGDVFNPAVCQGALFTAADAATFITIEKPNFTGGNYKWYGKSRLCSKLQGCLPWVQDEVMSYSSMRFYNDEVNEKIVTQPIMSLSGTATEPFFKGIVQVSKAIFPIKKDGNLKVENFYANSSYYSSLTPVTKEFQSKFGLTYTAFESIGQQGHFRKTCLWLNTKVVGKPNSSGQYMEMETVLFGTHR